MDCRQVREELSAYIDGVLGESLLLQLEAHLKGCPHCAAEAEELREVVGMVRALGDIAPPEGFRGRVMARVKNEVGATAGTGVSEGAGAGVLKHFARRGQFIAAAAVVVLGIGISVLWGKGLGPLYSFNTTTAPDKVNGLATEPEKKSETGSGVPENAKIALEDGRDKGLAGAPENSRGAGEQYDAAQYYYPNLTRKSIMSESSADRAQTASRGPGVKNKNDGKKVVSEGMMKINVRDMAYAESQVAKITADLGGRVEKDAVAAAEAGSLLRVVVPGDKFDRAVTALEKVGKVADKEVNSRDVSGELGDLEARIGGLEMKENQLAEMAGKTVSPVEKAAVEEDLRRTQEELAALREQLAQKDSAINFATITIELNRQG